MSRINPQEYFAMKMTSRKFVLVVGTFLVATYLLVFGKISERTWSDVVNWVVAAYVAGSVLEKSKWARDDASVNIKTYGALKQGEQPSEEDR